MSDSKPRPNILFIMSDDHAAHAMSCYSKRMEGRPVLNDTPNIDRIANEGMIMDNCFCTNSICTPSRAVILTGKYSHITGVTTLGTHLDNSQNNVAKILQAKGYSTGMVGKWHLGQGEKHHPTGFDYWNVLPGQGDYFDPKMIEMGEHKKFPGYVTDIITDKSLEFLKKRETDKPFFLMCHHKAPHRPWYPDDKHKDMFKDIDLPYPHTFNDDYKNRAHAAEHAHMRIDSNFNLNDIKVVKPKGIRNFWKRRKMNCNRWYLPPPKNIENYSLTTREGETVKFKSQQDLKNFKYQRYMKTYLQVCQSIDDNIGRLLDYLDNEGLTENTIVIYTSDQGFFLGDHGWYDKRFMYEESLRMPFMIRYPKKIKPASVNSDMILNLDFPETFLDYAGVKIDEEMQGESLRPILEGSTPDDWRKSMYYRYWVNGTFHHVYAHYGIRTHDYKLIYYYCDPLDKKGARKDEHEPEWELFDLKKDPFELMNEYNNPKYAEIIKKLKDELHTLQSNYKDTPYDEI